MQNLNQSTQSRSETADRRGFTLVELLVVIGIIALLISILLPALNRAREEGKRVQCLSNMRQVGVAAIMYTNEAKGMLPTSGEGPPQKKFDWVYWQPASSAAPYNDPTQCSLARYLSATSPQAIANIYTCPSDPTDQHYSNYGGRPPYPYSYTINAWISGDNSRVGNSKSPNITPYILRITQVRRASEKIWFAEEDMNTINDGMFAPEGSSGDTIADRHEVKRAAGTKTGEGRGNVVFCDGHASLFNRADLKDDSNWMPYK